MESFKTPEEVPKMFDPVVLPLPMALTMIAALATAVWLTNRWLQADTPNPWAGQPWATPEKATGRHRLAATAEPYRPRPWDEITAGLVAANPVTYGVLDSEVPLAEVEEYLRQIGVADWTQPLTAFEQRMGVMEPDTRELATIR